MVNHLKSLFSSGKKEDDGAKPLRIKSGIDGLGNPYIDLSDKNTAKAFMKKTKEFEGIKIV